MATKKKPSIDICGECACWFVDSAGSYNPCKGEEGECRLWPPVPISQYSSAYITVRKHNPACWQGTTAAKPQKKGKNNDSK